MFKKFLLVLLMMAVSSSVFARALWFHGGYVNRVLSESPLYGGCMIHLSNVLPADCVDGAGNRTGWVSLDCNKKYYSGGPRSYSTALVAMTTNLRVSVWIDTTKKHSGFCVVRRMDVYK